MSHVLTRRSLAPLLVAVGLGLARQPASGQEGLAEAENALRTGRYEEAIEQLEGIAKREPGSARAARSLARALAEVGQYERAEEAARRFATASPESPELWNTLGQLLLARGRRNEAQAAFEAAIAGRASDALVARLKLAILRQERGERAEALAAFDSFIDVYNRGSDLSSAELTAVATAVRYLGAEDFQLYKDALRAYDEAIAADPGNLEPRVLVGDLFLEKYQGGEAAASYGDVLAVNPSHPGALLGMARRARFDGDPEALALARRSLEVNPNLVAARVFVAELLLELEAFEEANDELRLALEVNPTSLEALAVKAAALYLQGDLTGYSEVERTILDLNPRFAGLYTRLADLSARVRLYREAVDFARRAVEIDSNSWRGYALLGTNQLRVGSIDEGRKNLEIAFKGDPYDLWTKNTLDLMDMLAGYTRTRSDRFVFTIEGDESDLLHLYFSDLAEQAFDRLVGLYGFEPPVPIQVEVYRNHADFSVRTIGLVGLGALGVSFGRVIAMDSPAARPAGDFNWGSTLWHELAHTFHLGLTRHRVPRWFSEGLAVYEERRARTGWGEDVTPGFLMAYLQDRLLPVSELNAGFARPQYPEQIIHSYFEASLVCEFIERQGGPRALVGMLEAYRDGLTTDGAFRRVLGLTTQDVDEQFFAHLEARFAGPLAAMRPEREPAHGKAPSRDEIARWAREDPGDFLAQLGFGHILVEEGRLDEALVYLERAKTLFPEYAGAGSAYSYLAEIHKRQGSVSKAIAELEALTSINERDLEAHLELATLKESIGDAPGAAAVLERAVYIHPYDPELHESLAGLFSRTGDRQAVVRERRALVALDPVDRAEALYQLARAYLEADDLGMARRTILRALEDAPNFEKAQELLLEIRDLGGGTR